MSGPEVIKCFSCSIQLIMKFVLLINLKLLTIANSFLQNIVEHDNVFANKYEKCQLMFSSLRKQAYSNIFKNLQPKKENFQIKNF